MLFPGETEYFSETLLMENFESVKLHLCSILNITPIEQYSENGSLIYILILVLVWMLRFFHMLPSWLYAPKAL
jgi:hypothetical protein